MAYCQNKNLSIYYEQHGKGRPVVLIHGSAVNFQYNYTAFGWVDRLNENNLQVIGLDLRGHGKSDKPLSADDYGTANIASDVLAVMDELGLDEVAIIGYSLGSAVALHLIQRLPVRFSKAALVATGDGLLGFPPYTFTTILPVLAEAVSRQEFPEDLPSHVAAYWNLVTESGGSREAISAAARANYPPLSVNLASKIHIPVMIVSGKKDLVLGKGPRLAETLPEGEYLEIQKADHYSLAANSRVINAVAEFIS